jgi:DNA-directed RNA polymerase subunit RPC12/RpoP
MNATKEHFMVQGKRLDNGKIVQGYYFDNGEDFKDYCRYVVIVGDGHNEKRHFVNPATIEHIAMKVAPLADKTDWLLGYKCPNCKNSIFHSRKADVGLKKHCAECGQRLSWEEK